MLRQVTALSNGAYGTVTRTLPLDPGMVQGWLADSGAANWGLLFK